MLEAKKVERTVSYGWHLQRDICSVIHGRVSSDCILNVGYFTSLKSRMRHLSQHDYSREDSTGAGMDYLIYSDQSKCVHWEIIEVKL